MLNLKLAWSFVGICIIITLLSGLLNISDLTIIAYGIPAIFGELGVHTAFILWKTKAENLKKLGKLDLLENDSEGI